MSGVQVLVASLPVGLASVDCSGTEASLLECSFSKEDVRQCGIDNTNLTKATVLACGNTGPSVLPSPPQQAFYSGYEYAFVQNTVHARGLPVESVRWPIQLAQAFCGRDCRCTCTADGGIP